MEAESNRLGTIGAHIDIPDRKQSDLQMKTQLDELLNRLGEPPRYESIHPEVKE